MNDNRTNICECGNPKSLRQRGCPRCMQLEARPSAMDCAASIMMRTLRHFDWLAVDDLYSALDLGEHDRSSYSQALTRLVRRGDIERRQVPAVWGNYRSQVTQVRLAQRKRRAA